MKDNGSTEAALHVCCTARICVANSSAASTISKCHDSRSEITRQCPALLWNSATAAITRWEDGGEITEQMASPHVTSQSCYEWLKMFKYHSETLNCISWWEYISCHCHLYFKNKKANFLVVTTEYITGREKDRWLEGGWGLVRMVACHIRVWLVPVDVSSIVLSSHLFFLLLFRSFFQCSDPVSNPN